MLDLEEVDDVVHIRIKGRLAKQDYTSIEPMIERSIALHGKARVLVELNDLNWVEPGAFWADIKFTFRHLNDLSRVAFVGDQRWLEWAARITRPFTASLVEHFDQSDLSEAWDWVRRDAE